ncbi:MAG: ribosome hibernation-promoting factor, HPF/YfiA family [Rhodothermales bacterium]
MQLQVTARHFEASPELRSYVERRASKLGRYFDGINEINVVLERNGNGVPEKRAEMSLRVFRQTLSATDSAISHEQAIDNCTERLRRQLMRYKAKLKSIERNVHR